ncbi:hypothetical protein AB9K34_02885 [Sedimentitalea sp. XS_ASV28]|uniref:hypothetical protein n=1 Tax=Sedimentitalea sp. XS_ASV28 TaxID=3241296 RepID=UPI003513D1DF
MAHLLFTRETDVRIVSDQRNRLLHISCWHLRRPKEQEQRVIRLAMPRDSLIFTSLAGTAVIVVLVTGQGTLRPILIAAATGAVLAIPVAYLVARRLYDRF